MSEIALADKILEVVKRLGALGFAAVYTQVHGSERASSLRVAHLALRFLNGDDVDSINADADAANETREKAAHHALQLKLLKKRKKANHG